MSKNPKKFVRSEIQSHLEFQKVKRSKIAETQKRVYSGMTS